MAGAFGVARLFVVCFNSAVLVDRLPDSMESSCIVPVLLRVAGMCATIEIMQIQTVSHSNFELVLPLIAAYQSHFKAEPDEARNRAHFAQFLTDHSRGIQFIALSHDGIALGFATLYFPFSSVRARVDCLMNDLFTSSCARRKGVGHALVQHCHQYAQEQGYDGLHWITAKTNVESQQFYASMGAERSEWYEYVLPT